MREGDERLRMVGQLHGMQELLPMVQVQAKRQRQQRQQEQQRQQQAARVAQVRPVRPHLPDQTKVPLREMNRNGGHNAGAGA